MKNNKKICNIQKADKKKEKERKEMLLYIVRHGETDWNKAGKVQGRTDIPLNERGRYLAEATAEGMKDVRIDFCYTSPLIRAKRDGADHTWGKRNSSG